VGLWPATGPPALSTPGARGAGSRRPGRIRHLAAPRSNDVERAVLPDGVDARGQRQLGELLVSEGLITDGQLAAALETQRKHGGSKPLGQILLDRNALTEAQLNHVIDRLQKRSRLGELLVRGGVITTTQLESALARQQTHGLPLGRTLLELNYISEVDLRKALWAQLNIAFVDLDKCILDRSLSTLINRSYAKRHVLVPIAKMDDALTVAMDDPTATAVIDELRASTGYTITVVTSTHAGIERAFRRVYEDGVAEPEEHDGRVELVADPSEANGKSRALEQYSAQRADELVRTLIKMAVTRGASDIHLETLDNHTRTRLRIDGVLRRLGIESLEDAISGNSQPIISRIKILAKLDITERRRPQDGSFRARVALGGQAETFDFRVSVVPGYYGENVLLRVLDPKRAPRSVAQLGFSRALTERFQPLLRRSTGIVVISGPTGSGKSTTLYAALMTLYRPDLKILTAEDPIEYVYEHFTQCEVNDRIGNTFASYLRAFLRHDPEVIMVGEIRDEATAEIAFQAAQTGHLLLTTLHTNDAISAVTRLQNLQVDTNIITSALLAVLSQRLVRHVCARCKEEYRPTPELQHEFFDTPPAGIRYYRGMGCTDCDFTGYKGRTPVGELWVPNEEDIILINKEAPFDVIRASAERRTLLMAADVWERLYEGQTNMEELMRALPYASITQFRRVAAERASTQSTAQAPAVVPAADRDRTGEQMF
jgi:type IV pilus assembly protein PilB